MALKLNNYKTITRVVPSTSTVVYTAPSGYTGVVLLGQIANISATSYDVTLIHRRGATDTEIVKNFPIAGNDTINLISGKLFLETGDQLVLSGSNASNLKFIASILETLN
jgi:hypothetical protein